MKSFGAVVAACVLAVGVGSAACSSSSAPAPECVESGNEALRTCAKATTLKGVDVSVYQGTVNFASVKSAGMTFAFIRTSDGLNTSDTKFATNWPAAKKAGLVRGVYQFFRPSQDGVAQADAMLDKITAAGGLDAGDLPPVLDLEVSDGESDATVQTRAKAWLDEVEKKIGVKPIVYTANFMSSVIGTGFKSYTLWVANYGASCPLMPDGWTDWQFWQDDDAGNVSGVSGATDTDVFNGTLAELQALAIKPASTPPSTPKPGDGSTPSSSDPNGSQGATLGSGNPPPAAPADPANPCAAN